MASLYDITKGEDVELYRILSQAGADAELARAIIKRPELAATMISAVREQLAPPLFAMPDVILSRLTSYTIHQGGWDLGEGWVKRLQDSVPTDHVSTLDHLLTLDIWLGDLPTTFEALATWIEYEQRLAGNGFWRWDGLRSDAEHLRLLNPERYGREPSIRWVELDMTANRGSRPKDVRNESSAGLQVMTAFAAHPAYPPAIDYETIPGAWTAGLQVNVPGSEAWTSVPILDWDRDDREVYLYAGRDDDRDGSLAVPVVREL